MSINLKQVSTVDIVTELLERAKHVDAFMSLVDAAKYTQDETPKSKTRIKHSLTLADIVTILNENNRPLTCVEIRKKMGKGTISAISAHMHRGIGLGAITRHGNHRPYAYSVAMK